MIISIITATYNSAKTLERTFQSVLNQTFKEIEYWVIDGGSTDGTLDIVRKYEPIFGGRMHWISERDKGIYDAMNKGVSRCTGDIIGLLNSDDFYKVRMASSQACGRVNMDWLQKTKEDKFGCWKCK